MPRWMFACAGIEEDDEEELLPDYLRHTVLMRARLDLARLG